MVEKTNTPELAYGPTQIRLTESATRCQQCQWCAESDEDHTHDAVTLAARNHVFEHPGHDVTLMRTRVETVTLWKYEDV